MSNCAFLAGRAAMSGWVPGFVILLGLASPAAAQLWTLPPPVKLMDISVRGIDSSYDPVHDVFLGVGAFGFVSGTFANNVGEPIGSPFTISTGGGHANYVRVQYSQDVNGGSGGFLVAWSAEDGTVRSQVVAYPGVLVGPEQIVATEPVWIESAPAIAYSATSRQFLVVWADLFLNIRARLVGLDGAPLGGIAQVSAGIGKTPGVAWNPLRNEFGVSYSGESGSSAFSAFAIVPSSNIDAPGAVVRNSFNFLPGGLTYITDLAFSPATGTYVMTWYEWPNSVVAAFDQAGTLLFVSPVSSRIGVYDSLSISFSPVSQTFLVAGLDPQNDFLTGAELAGNGVKIGFDTQLIGAGPAWYARSAPSTTSPMWQTVISRSFKLTDRVVFTGTTGGGSGSTPPPPPPSGGSTTPPPPTTTSTCPGGDIPGMICINGEYFPEGTTTSTSSCPGDPIPGMTCVNGDWIPDSSLSTTTSTSSCPGGPIPGMTCVNGNWIPDSSLSTTSTSSCPGGPIPGMTCVNGNWIPDSSLSTTSSSSCPGGPIPGMTCVNGNWIPDSSLSTTSSSSCPGGPIPGMTCVNGNWIPDSSLSTTSSSSCPGGPIPGMTCVNGNWIPDSSLSTTSSTSSCPGTVPGMTCVNGNWVIDTSTTSTTSTTSCPGTVPGMTCVNGDWIPDSTRLEPALDGTAQLARRLPLDVSGYGWTAAGRPVPLSPLT
jgi:hypothetical protein